MTDCQMSYAGTPLQAIITTQNSLSSAWSCSFAHERLSSNFAHRFCPHPPLLNPSRHSPLSYAGQKDIWLLVLEEKSGNHQSEQESSFGGHKCLKKFHSVQLVEVWTKVSNQQIDTDRDLKEGCQICCLKLKYCTVPGFSSVSYVLVTNTTAHCWKNEIKNVALRSKLAYHKD